jgi:hypothetical protein
LVPEWPRKVRVGSELTQLVADHVLGDIHRNVAAAVVDGDRVTDEGREDGGGPAPGLEDLLLDRTYSFHRLS